MFSSKALNKNQSEAEIAEKSLRLLKSKMNSRKGERETNANTKNFNNFEDFHTNNLKKNVDNFYNDNITQGAGKEKHVSEFAYNPAKLIVFNRNNPMQNDYGKNTEFNQYPAENSKNRQMPLQSNEKNFKNIPESNNSQKKIEEKQNYQKLNSYSISENAQRKINSEYQLKPATAQINIYNQNQIPQNNPKDNFYNFNDLGSKLDYSKENKRVESKTQEQNKRLRNVEEPIPNQRFQQEQKFNERLPKNNQGYNIDIPQKTKVIQPEKDAEMFECKEGCGRSFNYESYQKHVKVCKKVFQSQRKVFDIKKFRKNEDDNGMLLSTNTRKQEPKKTKAKKDWKSESEAFRAMIKQAKGHQLTSQEQEKMNENFEKAQNLVMCSFCGRKFNEKAAEKHIPFCEKKTKEEMMKNKKQVQNNGKNSRK